MEYEIKIVYSKVERKNKPITGNFLFVKSIYRNNLEIDISKLYENDHIFIYDDNLSFLGNNIIITTLYYEIDQNQILFSFEIPETILLKFEEKYNINEEEDKKTLKELIEINMNVNNIMRYIINKNGCKKFGCDLICKDLGIDPGSAESVIISYIRFLEDK